MKYSTIYLGNNKIEITNSLLGKEKIMVNNEIVSQKYSFLGAEHIFKITKNDTEAECKINMGFGLNGVVFDLYKDNEPVVVSQKSGVAGFIVIVIFVAIGYGLVDMFSHILHF